MPTSPLFVADVATLKSKIRLSGVPSTSDADDIINEAVLTVRAGFYRELGSTQIAAIQGITFVEDPASDDEVKRAVANVTEVKWVKAELMRAMPLMFMDGNAQQDQIFQDEALFRDASQRQLDQERIRLENEVEQAMELLRGDASIGSEGSIRIDSPTESQAVVDTTRYPAPRPGDTHLPLHLKHALYENRRLNGGS